MNASIILIILGFALLALGNMFWAGLGFIAVGVIVYSLPKKSGAPMFLSPDYQRVMRGQAEEAPQLGLHVRQKTPDERMGLVKRRKDVVPIDEHGVADIPLPVPDYLEDYVDLSYRKRVR